MRRVSLFQGFCFVPCFLINDLQLRDMRYNPERLRVGPRTPLACVRVFYEPLPVIGDTAKIEFVIEDPVAPLMVAVDGRGIPMAAPWAWDLFGIQ